MGSPPAGWGRRQREGCSGGRCGGSGGGSGADSGGGGGGDTVVGGLCVICRCGHAPDATVLACGHAYHPGCIDSWLAVRASCPLCAAAVTAAVGTRRVAASGRR